MKKLILLLLIIYMTDSYPITSAKLNKEQNILEFFSDIQVVNQKSKNENNSGCKIFTPLAPYNNVTCVVTAPKKVYVGQPFIIDFAINVRAATYLSFWADLLPLPEQMIADGLRLVGYTQPALGVFDEYAESVANRGGRGIWHFNQGVPAGTYHMSFTYVADEAGLKPFATLLATNPPSYIQIMEIEAIDEADVA